MTQAKLWRKQDRQRMKLKNNELEYLLRNMRKSKYGISKKSERKETEEEKEREKEEKRDGQKEGEAKLLDNRQRMKEMKRACIWKEYETEETEEEKEREKEEKRGGQKERQNYLTNLNCIGLPNFS